MEFVEFIDGQEQKILISKDAEVFALAQDTVQYGDTQELYTIIYFGNKFQLYVKGEIHEVARKLNGL